MYSENMTVPKDMTSVVCCRHVDKKCSCKCAQNMIQLNSNINIVTSNYSSVIVPQTHEMPTPERHLQSTKISFIKLFKNFELVSVRWTFVNMLSAITTKFTTCVKCTQCHLHPVEYWLFFHGYFDISWWTCMWNKWFVRLLQASSCFQELVPGLCENRGHISASSVTEGQKMLQSYF